MNLVMTQAATLVTVLLPGNKFSLVTPSTPGTSSTAPQGTPQNQTGSNTGTQKISFPNVSLLQCVQLLMISQRKLPQGALKKLLPILMSLCLICQPSLPFFSLPGKGTKINSTLVSSFGIGNGGTFSGKNKNLTARQTLFSTATADLIYRI